MVHLSPALVVLCALALPALGGAQGLPLRDDPLTFRDDLGAPVAGLEVCFQVHGARRCPEVEPGAGVRWPAEATALWAAGSGHGPVWVDREAPGGGAVGPEIVVPRKAELTVEGVPAGASLAFYRAGDRAFRVPLDRFRVLDSARRILAPPGATVLAIRERAGAPDLHRLDAPPGGAVRVRYTPRSGWSAVLRASAWLDRRPLPETTVRWIESSPTAPLARRSELAVLETGGDGLVLLSGLDSEMASAEVTREDHAPRTVHGLTAPPGGLLYQEVDLRPGGTVAARIIWRGEPAGGLRAALFARPTDPDPDPDQDGAPGEVVFRGHLDDDGRLRLEHVPEGRYLLRVRAPDGSGHRGHADLVLRVEDRQVAEITADLHPRSVRGRVTRGGQGGQGAAGHRLHARVVRAIGEPNDEGRRRTVLARTAQGEVVTGEDGSYELTLLADGVYRVELHAADGTPIGSRYVELRGGDAEASFRLAAEPLRGRVVSSRGGVVGDAKVWVRWGEGGHIQRARSDPDGRFEFPFEADRATQGPVIAGAIREGWLGDEREVAIGDLGAPRFERIERDEHGTVRVPGPEIDEPAHPDRIELILHPLERVRGRVVDAEGRPLPGAWVASCRAREGSPLVYVGSGRTAADGIFEVPSGVPDGAPPPRREPVRLYVSAPGCPLTEARVEPPRGSGPGEDAEPAPVTIVCDTPPAVLRAHVAFSRSHPLPGERITLRRDGLVLPPQVLEGHLDELGLPHTTGEDGQLLLVLAPGRWEIYRESDTSATEIGTGDQQGLLGTVALDPWTVTDLFTGADE